MVRMHDFFYLLLLCFLLLVFIKQNIHRNINSYQYHAADKASGKKCEENALIARRLGRIFWKYSAQGFHFHYFSLGVVSL